MKLKKAEGWFTAKEDSTYRSQDLMLNQGALLMWYSENLCRTQNVVWKHMVGDKRYSLLRSSN